MTRGSRSSVPSVSEKQRRYMGWQLGKAEKGERTETAMSVNQLRDFARKPIRPSGRSSRR
jgi:hypothetical protein